MICVYPTLLAMCLDYITQWKEYVFADRTQTSLLRPQVNRTIYRESVSQKSRLSGASQRFPACVLFLIMFRMPVLFTRIRRLRVGISSTGLASPIVDPTIHLDAVFAFDSSSGMPSSV